MKKIYVATKARGFLINLFAIDNKEFKFIYDKKKVYETNSKLKSLISVLAKSTLANYLGLIQRIKINEQDADIYFSYNRFLNVRKDYVIYLENPLALVHYSIGRNKTLISKLKLKKYLNDKNIKAIVCLSKACYETVNNFYDIPETIKLKQIYPLVTKNTMVTKDVIGERCRKKEIQCLYISADFNLKGGMDILKCFEKIEKDNVHNIKLKIITQIDRLDEKLKQYIINQSNIYLYDFKFNKTELANIYSESSILLNPTRQDSFSLVVLEAIKAGNTVISSDLYAIPEMVKDNYNGYLTGPKYRFFEYNNMPNEYVWKNRNKTIYSNYIDEKMVDFLYEKITYLNNNREILIKFSENSLKISSNNQFDENSIIKEWNKILT